VSDEERRAKGEERDIIFKGFPYVEMEMVNEILWTGRGCSIYME